VSEAEASRYGSSYREEVRLSDGTRLLVHALDPNAPIRHLVEDLGLPVRSKSIGSTITVEVALDRQRRSA